MKKKQSAICVMDGGYRLTHDGADVPLCYLLELLLFEFGLSPEFWLKAIKGNDVDEIRGNYSIMSKQNGLVYLNLQFAQDGIENPIVAKGSFVTSAECLVDIIERWNEIRSSSRFNKIKVIYENGKVLFFGSKINNSNLLHYVKTKYWDNEPLYTLLKRKDGEFEFGHSRLGLADLVGSQDTRLALFLANDVQGKAKQWIEYIEKPVNKDFSKGKISKYVKYFQSGNWITIGCRPLCNPCDPFNFDTYSDELIAILDQWDKLYNDSNVKEITMLYKDGDIALMGNS